MRLIINIDKGFASIFMNLQADEQREKVNSVGLKAVNKDDFLEAYGSWEMPDPENTEHLK